VWAEAEAWFEAHKRTLRGAGIELRARLMPDSGLMSSYANGVVRLALPDAETPAGALRRALFAATLRLSEREVGWLFGAMLPRLVAHEIGHALRDEAGRLGPDPWWEEQAADRMACLLSRPHLGPSVRARAVTMLEPVVDALGGLAEALAGYRHPDLAKGRGRLCSVRPTAVPDAARYRDFATFQRMSVAWSYLDLMLDPEDSFDDYRNDMLLARRSDA